MWHRALVVSVRVIGAVAALIAVALTTCAVSTASNGGYRIQPRDLLAIRVLGDDELSSQVTVLPSGEISLPLVGTVRLSGKTADQAAALLSGRLKPFVRDPVVTVSVLQAASMRVLVLGDVKEPGRYEINANSRVTDALAAAGGLAPTDGPPPDARVTDAEGNSQSVSLVDLLKKGQSDDDVTLNNGDVVYVPVPVRFVVNVSGAVDHPGDVDVRQGDGVAVAITKAGDSVNAGSDLNHVQIIRQPPSGRAQTFTVNLYSRDSQPWSGFFPLQKGDLVYVPKARKGVTTLDLYNVLTGLRLFFPL
jgi:polysaccharide export outer membrane protein